MHLHHKLNQPDSGKLGFIASTRYDNFYYLEYNENQSTTAIERITRFNFTLPFTNYWIVGSCNGIICLAGYHGDIVCICNPITRQHDVLQIKNDFGMFCSFGFGLVSSTNEYKVVRIHYRINEFVQVHIYTLGSGNGWRNFGKFDPDFSPYPWKQGVFANGALYWLNEELKMITTFDLSQEMFCQHLSLPPLLSPPDGCCDLNTIRVLDGFLFFSTYLDDQQEDMCYEVLLLKKKNDDHGMKEHPEDYQSMVWSREFRIDLGELLAVMKTKGVLTYNDTYLSIYDIKVSTSKSLVDFKKQFAEVLPHRNTLVSLKELGEEDTKIMASIQIEEIESHVQPSVIEG